MRILSWNLVRIPFVAPFIQSVRVLKHLGTRTGSGQYLNIIRAQLYDVPTIYASNGQCRWNTFKYWDAILKELRADIICFQGAVSRRGYPSTCMVHVILLRNEEQSCSNRP